jgi:hypothetical protein
MTSKEFVLWLKGFTEGVHEFNITPKQWDNLKEKLAEVNDDNSSPFPFGTPNIQQITPNPFIQPPPTDPYNPFKITCGSGSSGTITTTPYTTGFITTYNPSTSTTYGYPSGSAWHYTNS